MANFVPMTVLQYKIITVILPGGSAGEENYAFEFAVVEEVVERPDAALLTVRV